MRTTNMQLIEELKLTKNIITKNSIENILLGRCNRGDMEAGVLLTQWLKGWIK